VYETFQKFPSLAVKKFPSQIALKTSHWKVHINELCFCNCLFALNFNFQQ
jgi:hypothetical protein